MRRNLGPLLQRELKNLDKDADSRKSAMKALKYYVKEMDSNAIPLFIAHVSESKEVGPSTGEYTISLYEVLARVHGPKIVPQIDNIMIIVIKTLSAGSLPLHQACSKVVPAIARYAIDPTTSEDKKKHIIHSLAKPLSDSLLASQENLSIGSAFCLKALVESDNWRFASSEIVNDVCQRVAGALEIMQTKSHIGLVMALAKSNSLVVEAYARLLIQSGLRILSAGVAEGNSQKRLSAIQMVNLLMRCLDPKSIFSELGLIVEEMEKCQSDQMVYVKGAAFEALQTAKKIVAEEEKIFETGTSLNNGSSYCRSKSPRRTFWGVGDQSSLSISPESQTVDSSVGSDPSMESPSSTCYASRDLNGERRSVNRKHWQRFDNGGSDVCLEDDLFSELTPRSVIDNSQNDEFSRNREDYTNGFAGFSNGTPKIAGIRSATPSPQRQRYHINVDDVEIFTTPRKLISSLQDTKSENSEISEKQSRRFRTPCASRFESSPASKVNGFSCYAASDYDNIYLPNMNHDPKNSNDDNEGIGSSDSVLSSEYVPVLADAEKSTEQIDSRKITVQNKYLRSALGMVCGLFAVLFAVFVCLMWNGGDRDEGYNLLPT